MDRKLYNRNQFNYSPPQQTVMSQYDDSLIPMSELDHTQPGHSRNPDPYQNPGNFDDWRPNRVISGHRKLNRTTYTGPRVNFDHHANKIVQQLEENEALLEDSPISEELRKHALRDLPQCLTMKRCVKMKLSMSVSQKNKGSKPIGFVRRLKYRISINFTKFKNSLNNFNYFELWHGTLKDIQGHFGSGYASYFKFLRWLFVMNVFTALLSFSLIVVPQILYDSSGQVNKTQSSQGFQFQNIFIGDGLFKESVLYYGHYTNDAINLIPHLFFNMPDAYFSVTVFLYLFSFFVLGISVAQSYRRTFIETEGGLQNVYAHKIFCGWDFGIATEEAAELKSSAIYRELKELLSESLQEKQDRPCLYRFWTCTVQVIANILILIILAAIGWSSWLLLEKFSLEETNDVLVTTIIINIVMIVFPVIFNFISRYEEYGNPRTALYITLTRTFLLSGVIIGAILTFWLSKAESTDCWENRLGAEIYRLIIFDFIFAVVLTTLTEIAYSTIRKIYGKNPKSEFNISKHILQICYNQALLWVGFMYSPILPILVTLKMLVIWYIREGCVRKFCRPPDKTWRAAQAQTYFMMIIFISILMIIAVHGYTLKSIAPSSCGPFRDYDFMYQIVTQNVADFEETSAGKVVMQITKPGTIALILIGLCILVYYLKEQAFAQKEKVRTLREMLSWAAKDKEFLVKWYISVTKGGFDYSVRDQSLIDHTQLAPYQSYNGYNSDSQQIEQSISDDEFNARFKKFS